MIPDRLLRIPEACAYLGVCRNTLLRMIEDGQVEAVDIRRPGGRYAILRIKAASLERPINPEDRIRELDIERRAGV